jgi:hypothetical protein
MSVFRAATPNQIRCPHCKTRVRYIDTRRVMWMLMLIAALIFGLSFVLVTYIWKIEKGIPQCLAIFGLVFVSWMLVELATAHYLRRNKTLECTPNRSPR